MCKRETEDLKVPAPKALCFSHRSACCRHREIEPVTVWRLVVERKEKIDAVSTPGVIAVWALTEKAEQVCTEHIRLTTACDLHVRLESAGRKAAGRNTASSTAHFHEIKELASGFGMSCGGLWSASETLANGSSETFEGGRDSTFASAVPKSRGNDNPPQG